MSSDSTPIRIPIPARAPEDKRRRLGKGLGALLGESRKEEPLVRDTGLSTDASDPQSPSSSALKSIATSAIRPLPGNPRKHFDENALDELAA